MPTPQTLGKRIAQARRELGVREQRDVTQLDVAKAIGATGASVSEWEADKKSPREDALRKLAKFLGVTPAYLRYGVGDSTPMPAEPPVVPFTPVPYTPRDAFEVLREQREAAERAEAEAKPTRKKNGSKGRGGGRA